MKISRHDRRWLSPTRQSLSFALLLIFGSAAMRSQYVANYRSNNVTVISGATNLATTVSDPNAQGPWHLAVNPVSNKVYVGNYLSNNITVIDGITDSTSTVVDGDGSEVIDVAANPVNGQIYAANWGSNFVTAIAEQPVQSIPVTATIKALPGNKTQSTTPTFNFSTTDTFKPNQAGVNSLLFLPDTCKAHGAPPRIKAPARSRARS